MYHTGDQFLQYQLGPQIGQGGYGKIFAVRDIETGLIYALKLESISANRKTLKFETKIMHRIQGNPHFPKIFDFGDNENGSWVIMELCGPSLEHIRRRFPERKFSLSTAIRTSIMLLKAIQELHNCGIIHRDIKPSNVLVRLTKSNKPNICLIDFGLARMYINPSNGKLNKERQTTGFRGTKSYASINSHKNHDLSRRDDLISS